MSPYAEILALFAVKGGTSYFGESISTTQHALQAAYFAQQAHAPEALVLAALLHDIGHLIDAAPNDLAQWTNDAHHEEVGAQWLAQRFGLDVSEPVRLHVRAKRFLCATSGGYAAKLSAASLVTLELQGGPMTPVEVAKFAAHPYQQQAIRLRQWDDAGKVVGLQTPELAAYQGLIESRYAKINDV